jgi:E3 ubiquitin-protein ligase DOA10
MLPSEPEQARREVAILFQIEQVAQLGHRPVLLAIQLGGVALHLIYRHLVYFSVCYFYFLVYILVLWHIFCCFIFEYYI